MTWGWRNGDVWFAVMIHVPLQEGNVGNARNDPPTLSFPCLERYACLVVSKLTKMGTTASYKVSWSSPKNKSVDWSQPVKNPGQSWIFPSALGRTVRVNSQAGAQVCVFALKISVDAQFSDDNLDW